VKIRAKPLKIQEKNVEIWAKSKTFAKSLKIWAKWRLTFAELYEDTVL